jgi:hypothetical protein
MLKLKLKFVIEVTRQLSLRPHSLSLPAYTHVHTSKQTVKCMHTVVVCEGVCMRLLSAALL